MSIDETIIKKEELEIIIKEKLEKKRKLENELLETKCEKAKVELLILKELLDNHFDDFFIEYLGTCKGFKSCGGGWRGADLVIGPEADDSHDLSIMTKDQYLVLFVFKIKDILIDIYDFGNKYYLFQEIIGKTCLEYVNSGGDKDNIIRNIYPEIISKCFEFVKDTKQEISRQSPIRFV